MYSPGPGLWTLDLGPSVPDLGSDLDLTWDLDMDLRLHGGLLFIVNYYIKTIIVLPIFRKMITRFVIFMEIYASRIYLKRVVRIKVVTVQENVILSVTVTA